MKMRNSKWIGINGLALWMMSMASIAMFAGCGDDVEINVGGLAKRVDNAIGDKVPYSKAKRLLELIPECEKASMSSLADKCLSGAADASKKVHDKGKRATIFVKLAKAQLKAKKTNLAEKSLGEAKEAVDEVKSTGRKIELLASIAGGYKDIDVRRGVKYVKEAEGLVGEVKSVAERSRLLGNIAKAYHSLGKAGETTRMFNEMIAKAKKEPDAIKAVNLRVAIAAVYNALGKKDEAWKQGQAAQAKVDEIDKPGTQAIMLCKIAVQASKAGRIKNAKKLLQKANILAEDSAQTPSAMNDAVAMVKNTRKELGL